MDWWTGDWWQPYRWESCRVGIQEALFRFPNASVMGYDLDQSVVQRAQQRLRHRAQVQSDTCFNGRTLCSGDVGTGEFFRLIKMEQKHSSVMFSHFFWPVISVFPTWLPCLCDFDGSICLFAKEYTALPAEGFDLILAKLASSWDSIQPGSAKTVTSSLVASS